MHLRIESLGHPFWWHGRRTPKPDAQLLDKYYGVDDVSRFSGTLEETGGGKTTLSGSGAYEAMYIDNAQTNRAWQKQHWFFWITPEAFGLVLDFDNYFDGYVVWRERGAAWRLQHAQVTLGQPDAQGHPQHLETTLRTPEGVLELSGNRIHKDLVYGVPILIGQQEFQDVHLIFTGRLTRPDGSVVNLGEGYGMDQILVPASAAAQGIQLYPVKVH